MKLRSFDIFDTLITRAVAAPKDIFFLMQLKLTNDILKDDIPLFLKQNFMTIRLYTENFVRENIRINDDLKEITIYDIYRQIQINFQLTNEQLQYLINLEIEIEKSNLLPIYENIDKLKKNVLAGYKVILISDMYYDKNILRTFLLQFDDIFKEIEIFVSSEYKAKKRKGTLYKIIRNKYKNIKEWKHTGDDFIADFVQAMLNGIKTEYYHRNSKLLNYEKYLLNNSHEILKAHLMISCSMKLRNTNQNNKYHFGCSFAGPLLYNYTQWVLEQCIKLNIKDLYFVARDGYIIKKIADLLIKNNNYNLKTNYFYSSRIASRVIFDENYSEYIECVFMESFTNKSISKIFKTLNTSIQEISKELNFSVKYFESLTIESLKKLLLENINIKNFIINKNKEKFDIFVKYIKQELPSNVNKIAFIDINGSGRTQDIITKIINKFYSCTTYNFYFHNSLSVKNSKNSVKCAYFASRDYLDDWIELLCRCPEAQTIGYKQGECKIAPIKEVNNNFLLSWGYEDYLNGVLDYASAMQKLENNYNISTNFIELFLIYYKYLNNSLDKKTADIIGTIPFARYGSEITCKECAPKITCQNLFVPKHLDYISIARSAKYIRPVIKWIKFIINPQTYAYIKKEYKLAYIKLFGLKIDISNLIWKNYNIED